MYNPGRASSICFNNNNILYMTKLLHPDWSRGMQLKMREKSSKERLKQACFSILEADTTRNER